MIFNLDNRVSVFAVCLTALSILVGIKLSNYILPSAFYFSISSVFKSQEGAMLISPPGLSSERFCELIRKNRIHPQDVGFYFEDCAGAKYAENSTNNWGRQISQGLRDEIYSAWYSHNDEITEQLSKALKHNSTTMNVFANIGNITPPTGPIAKSLREFRYSVAAIVNQNANRVGGEIVENAMPNLISKIKTQEELKLQGDDLPFNPEELVLTDKQISQLKRDFPTYLAQKVITSSQSDLFTNLKLKDIDAAVTSTFSYQGLSYNIFEVYQRMVYSQIDEWTDEFLKEIGVDTKAANKNIANAKSDFFWDNLPSYIIAAIIRVLIVFLMVMIIATIFRRHYNISDFAFGSLFAALLLTWPIINQWHLVVEADWQDMRYKFLMIYVLYGVAFFFTGKAAALSAEVLWSKYFKSKDQTIETQETSSVLGAVNISIRELINNFAIAISLNGIAYAFNLIIPINA